MAPGAPSLQKTIDCDNDPCPGEAGTEVSEISVTTENGQQDVEVQDDEDEAVEVMEDEEDVKILSEWTEVQWIFWT